MFRFFIPGYDELALFLIDVAFLFLFATDPTLQDEAHQHLFAKFNILVLLILLFFAAGLVFSIYHAFAKRAKTDPERWLMLFFAVAVNYFAALCAGIYIFTEWLSWWVIFPILNIIDGVVLVTMAGIGLLDETYVSDQNVRPRELLAGTAILVLLLLGCRYVLHFYWAITFSVCVAYATKMSGAIAKWTRPAPHPTDPAT